MSARIPLKSQALSGETIALEEVHDGVSRILLYTTLLGRYDERTNAITGAPSLGTWREPCPGHPVTYHPDSSAVRYGLGNRNLSDIPRQASDAEQLFGAVEERGKRRTGGAERQVGNAIGRGPDDERTTRATTAVR